MKLAQILVMTAMITSHCYPSEQPDGQTTNPSSTCLAITHQLSDRINQQTDPCISVSLFAITCCGIGTFKCLKCTQESLHQILITRRTQQEPDPAKKNAIATFRFNI